MAYAKQTFPTIYLKPMTLNEKEAVRDAISDWRADGVQMTDDDATTLIYQWCEQQLQLVRLGKRGVFGSSLRIASFLLFSIGHGIPTHLQL